jgi:hypothetical protein
MDPEPEPKASAGNMAVIGFAAGVITVIVVLIVVI